MINNEQKLLREELQYKPNRIVGIAMLVSAVIATIIWMLNEIDLFRVGKTEMRIAFGITIPIILAVYATSRCEYIANQKPTKYVYVGVSLISTAVLVTFLEFHAVLTLFLPLLIASQYKTVRVIRIALCGTVIITLITPIVSAFMGFWDIPFLYKLAELANQSYFTVVPDISDQLTTREMLIQIVGYISIPRALVVAAMSCFVTSVCKSNREDLKAKITMMRINERDTLTGLYNQNMFKEVCACPEKQLAENIGVIYFDVNGLKSMNDEKGHEYGDLFLKRCSESIHMVENEKVFGFRIGGDEMLVVVESDFKSELENVLKEWRNARDILNFETDKKYHGIKISMSYGIAWGRNEEFNDLIQSADAAMYDNKTARKLEQQKMSQK